MFAQFSQTGGHLYVLSPSLTASQIICLSLLGGIVDHQGLIFFSYYYFSSKKTGDGCRVHPFLLHRHKPAHVPSANLYFRTYVLSLKKNVFLGQIMHEQASRGPWCL